MACPSIDGLSYSREMGSGPFGDARLYRSGRYHHGFFPLAASINSFMASHGRTLWSILHFNCMGHMGIWRYRGDRVELVEFALVVSRFDSVWNPVQEAMVGFRCQARRSCRLKPSALSRFAAIS